MYLVRISSQLYAKMISEIGSRFGSEIGLLNKWPRCGLLVLYSLKSYLTTLKDVIFVAVITIYSKNHVCNSTT